MEQEMIQLIPNDTIAAAIYTVLTLTFIILPFIILKAQEIENEKLKEKYIDVFTDPNEAIDAYNHDKKNLVYVEPYKKESVISIIFYFITFYVLASVIASVSKTIYLKANGFSSDIINPDSDLFVEDIYNHMINFLSPILEIIIYSILTVGLIIIMRNVLKEDLSKLNKKTFAFGAMGFGLTIAASYASTMLFTILGITERKPEASNQEAILSMFTSPLAIFLLFFVIVIMAPLVEELIFRKAIFKVCKNDKLGIVVSTLIFGGLHVISSTFIACGLFLSGEATYLDVILELVFIIQYSLMGLGFGIAYIKSGKNIFSSIFAHILNNGLSFIMMLLAMIFPEFFGL